jgi:biopolymer transport protein ExbB/TolQ
MIFQESLGSFFVSGGVMMYPLFAVAVAALGYALAAGRRLRQNAGGPDPRLESAIDAVLFWGSFGVVLGLLGTLIGIVQAARAIELAGGVEARLAWGGIRVSLPPTIFALFIFGIAALAWFFLRSRYARRTGAVAG